jgi:PBP1b-binding outer membrane lipoprotein LpoB
MKTLKTLSILALVLIISSCANTAKFPISNVTPAADIVATMNHDKNGNNKITITAKNLAAVERLDPPKSAYVVWIVTEKDGVRNIGKLLNKNAHTTGLETLTPFKFSEVFITAEDQADASYPTGIEISRIKVKQQ